MDRLVDFENQVKRYEDVVGEQLAESIEAATLLRQAPEKIREHLQISAQQVGPNYEAMKAAIENFLDAKRVWTPESLQPPPATGAQGSGGPAPMD
eukprot:14228455-Alexandrium_andersonii.AAC.1